MLVGDDRNDIITFSPIVVDEEGKLAALGSRGRGPNEVWEGLVSPPHSQRWNNSLKLSAAKTNKE